MPFFPSQSIDHFFGLGFGVFAFLCVAEARICSFPGLLAVTLALLLAASIGCLPLVVFGLDGVDQVGSDCDALLRLGHRLTFSLLALGFALEMVSDGFGFVDFCHDAGSLLVWIGKQ